MAQTAIHRVDFAVVGGGAAGLAAAIVYKQLQPSHRVVVLERLPKIGKKILATGNGRCNIGHTPITPAHYHGSVDPTLALTQYGDTEAFFATLGLFLRTDSEGRLYPLSNQATAVLDTLQLAIKRYGVEVWCDGQVTDLQPRADGFLLHTADRTLFATKVVVTVGGAAAPAFGTDGNFTTLLERCGHTIIPLRPTLCPLPAPIAKRLSGLRMTARCTAYRGSQRLAVEVGEVQFSHNQLSGICIFNLATHRPDRVVLDLFDGLSETALVTMLQQAMAGRPEATGSACLTGVLPQEFATQLLIDQKLSPTTRLTNAQLVSLAKALKAFSVPITGQGDFARAQTTAGGISGKEVTARLESKLYKGLFFAGEVLDVDGDCGGYNLHFAWSSARLVAHTAAGQPTFTTTPPKATPRRTKTPSKKQKKRR